MNDSNQSGSAKSFTGLLREMRAEAKAQASLSALGRFNFALQSQPYKDMQITINRIAIGVLIAITPLGLLLLALLYCFPQIDQAAVGAKWQTFTWCCIALYTAISLPVAMKLSNRFIHRKLGDTDSTLGA